MKCSMQGLMKYCGTRSQTSRDVRELKTSVMELIIYVCRTVYRQTVKVTRDGDLGNRFRSFMPSAGN